LALDTPQPAREELPVVDSQHPFDAALTLTAIDSSPESRKTSFTGRTHPAYQNMVGPYGGLSAAQALQAVVKHPALLGQPVALTVNFAAAIADGEFQIDVEPVRTNRSTQHWSIVFTQRAASGAASTVLTGTAMTALRRETWSATDLTMPAVPRPSELPRAPLAGLPTWFQRYDMRFCTGTFPEQWDGAAHESLTQVWVRDDPDRALDITSLAAMCDVFYPRIWLRRATPTPAGTVTLTSYFHVGSAELAAASGGYLFAQARGVRYFNGYFDQNAQLWSEAGQLLATSHQLVYFKE
jgi:acyl-CoA thioesterase